MQGPALQDGLSREMAGLASGNKALLLQSTASQPFQNNAPLLQSTVSLMTTEGERRVCYEWEIDCPSIGAWKKFGCFALRQLKRKRLFGHLGQFLQTIKARGRIQQMAGHMQKNLNDVYTARSEQSAQAFLCRGPGGVTIDVVNAHAPSGSEKLTDKPRIELLTNLLQSNSMALPGTSLGNGRFLIGGDLNTGPHATRQLLVDDRHTPALSVPPQLQSMGLENRNLLSPQLQSMVPPQLQSMGDK